jgi:hypothetical protein
MLVNLEYHYCIQKSGKNESICLLCIKAMTLYCSYNTEFNGVLMLGTILDQ